MPDSLATEMPLSRSERLPTLAERFLPPPGFVWDSFTTADGAVLRCGHLPVAAAPAECVVVGGFGEFIEIQFETVRDLGARGLAVWGLDWRGQGGSSRPRRWPNRARARCFDDDAADLAAFVSERLTSGRPRLLIAHSMGGAIALLCLHHYPGLFAGAILSAPMLGLRIGRIPPAALRSLTGPIRLAGLGVCFVPGTRRFRPNRVPSPETSRMSSDPERCRLRHAWFLAEPGLRVGRPTYAWLDTALGLIARIGRPEFLGRIDTPILIGSAGRDRIVATTAQRRAARLLPDCTLVELPHSKHEPFLEEDGVRRDWFRNIDRFLAERVGIPVRRGPDRH